jgi:hypothetical protein
MIPLDKANVPNAVIPTRTAPPIVILYEALRPGAMGDLGRRMSTDHFPVDGFSTSLVYPQGNVSFFAMGIYVFNQLYIIGINSY